jgi:UDP-N-acetylmuramoyl-L-alanyl-D-glutamate--2,6-diaminopimelate ligase
MTLGRLADRLRDAGVLRRIPEDGSWRDTEISTVVLDSRLVLPGALFCAIVGTEVDSHAHVASAARAGAAAALVEREVAGATLPQFVVADGRQAAAHAAAAFHGDPWDGMRVIGVTGTNGKTTVAAIVRHLISRRSAAASIGTLGVVGADGAVIPGTEGLTTPGPVEVAERLRGLRDAGVEAVVMEVSSHALDQGRVAAVRFDAGVFTNLSRDHLDYHGDLERYRAAKLRLLRLLKPGAAAVVNADDAVWKGVEAEAERLVSFGTGREADVRAEDVAIVREGMEFTLQTPDGSAAVGLPLFGAYNVSNALAASAALWSLGWTAAELAEGLADLPQIPGRLERVPTPSGKATVLIDFAHTPDALARALGAVRPLVRGRLMVVFGAGGDRDRGKRSEMGRVAARAADLAIVTSDNPRTEDPERIIDDIEAGMGDARRRRIPDRKEAIAWALANAGAEDVIVLAGKGHETYQIRGTEKLPFDERAVVRSIFAGKDTT